MVLISRGPLGDNFDEQIDNQNSREISQSNSKGVRNMSGMFLSDATTKKVLVEANL